MKTIVYSASQGEYSGYQVCALFTTREKAIKYCADRIIADCGSWCSKCCNFTSFQKVDDYNIKCSLCGVVIDFKKTGNDFGQYFIEKFDLDPESEEK